MKRKFYIAHAGNSLEQVKASQNIRDMQVQGMVYEWRGEYVREPAMTTDSSS